MNDIAEKNVQRYLQPTVYINSDSPQVRSYTEKALLGLKDKSDKARAICLFEQVRDGHRYDPFNFKEEPETYKASHVVGEVSAWCVPKAILLTACLRATGIPAAVGFADVKNHLITPKLAELMQTDLFIYHGYVELWLDDKSYKVTPAFNMDLCHKFDVKPLVFDGQSDALFHEFDVRKRRHMEYIHDHGIFHDAPVLTILEGFRKNYPRYNELLKQEKAHALKSGSEMGFAP